MADRDAAHRTASSSTPRSRTPRTARRCSSNFLWRSAARAGTGRRRTIRREAVARIREQVGDGRVICGLSGGVDSTVAAALLREAIGDRLAPIFVDNGLLRQGRGERGRADLRRASGIDLDRVDAARALPARPGRRRRAGAEAQDHRPQLHRGVQGARRDASPTPASWPRARSTPTSSSRSACAARRRSSRPTTTSAACRSGSASSWSSRCATCSRTRCGGWARSWACPRVRLAAPVPGPGPGRAHPRRGRRRSRSQTSAAGRRHLHRGAPRAPGCTTRSAQAFAVLLPVRTRRRDGRPAHLRGRRRAARRDHRDFMTADWGRFPTTCWTASATASSTRCAGINRVVYDVTCKPPGTIEWE